MRCRAIEAFVSRAHNPLADRHALHAVNLITAHLLRTQLRPKASRPRVAMAQGSRQAGMALTNAMLGATHAMSHQVGGLLDAPQGLVNGVLLPHIIRFNAQVWPHRFVPLAAAGGHPPPGGGPPPAARGPRRARAPGRGPRCAE